MNYSIEYVRKMRKEYGLTTEEIEGFFDEMNEIDELEAQELYEEHFFTADYNDDLPRRGKI